MRKLIIIALATISMIGLSAHAQIDYIGNHAETVRENNLRRHQQEMLKRRGKSSKQKSSKRKKQTNFKRSIAWKKEPNVSASRLRVGDVIHSARYGKDNIVFKNGAVRVASRAPLTLNINNTVAKAIPKGNKTPMGGFAVITSTGRRTGVIGFMTFKKPGNVKFTRLTK